LANNWADFEGGTAYFTANVHADWNPLVNQIEQGAGLVFSVIGIIIAV
jgi:hypothetical protein